MLPLRLLLLTSSSAEEDHQLCQSDLGTAMRLSRIVSFMLRLAKANKEEGGLADFVVPRLGREEKGLGKARGKPSALCQLEVNRTTHLPRFLCRFLWQLHCVCPRSCYCGGTSAWLLADLLETAVLAVVFASHSPADTRANFEKLILISIV